MQDFEKLGSFYLGRTYDLPERKLLDDLFLYDAPDLTTHGVCVGMTGSGKTGLCVALLEEAAIDGIPSIVIDPKGDLGNLLLTFPNLAPEDFRPWVDEEEAARAGVTPDEFAAQTAQQWREGLAQWGQDGERIARLKAAAEVVLYTPGSTSGTPLNVLHSFDAPPPELAADAEAMGDRIESAVSGLLALLGIEADPVRSREHILLSNILREAWSQGRNMDLAGLIAGIQTPAFDKIGVLDLEAVYPAKERFELAISLNNLLASPGFAPWLTGDPLDAQRLLYAPDGRARISVLSLAHLSDAERMFFVTLLLNEVLSWVRRQPGTSSLRAVLYMDEVYGYFPPIATPPAKRPMLTLLKQARAYGLGILLATQNPVDLDYKGLANAGTWFIGRLQTDRDKQRLLDGLEGVAASTQLGFSREHLDQIISSLGKRVFLMHNIHEQQPVVFQTRWTLSYLRGPLTLAQIHSLTPQAAPVAAVSPAAVVEAAPVPAPVPTPPPAKAQVVAPEVRQLFVPAASPVSAGARLLYKPTVLGAARLHYIRVTAGVDFWRELVLAAQPPPPGEGPSWEAAQVLSLQVATLQPQPPSGPADLEPVSGELAAAASYPKWQGVFEDFVYQRSPLVLWQCASMKAVSRPDENEGAFRGRLDHMAREQRDLAVQKLRDKYAAQVEALQDRIKRTEERLEREKAEYGQQVLQTTLSVGTTLVGALFGRKLVSQRTVSRAGSSLRGAGRSMREKGEVGRAEGTLEEQQAELAALENELAAEIAAFEARQSPAEYVVEELGIRPRKNELEVAAFGLGWLPYEVGADGVARPLFGLGGPQA
ncbi:MAG: ATP-binding protein [Armatimonadia bacterium]